MNHYICSGECQGVSDKPGVCQADTCPKHNQPLIECDCSDNKHGGVFDSTHKQVICGVNPKSYFLITGVIFAIIGVFHLSRIIFGWEVIFSGIEIPLWPSWIFAVIAGYLSYQAFRLGSRS